MSIDVEALAKALHRLGYIIEPVKAHGLPDAAEYDSHVAAVAENIAAEYARLIPAEDEGRLREALAAVELYPTQWQEGLPVDIDTYRRGILAILRAALAATPEPR